MARKAVKREQGPSAGRNKAPAAAPVHRYTFLQWLMPKGYDLQSEAERIYRKLTGAKDCTDPTLPPPSILCLSIAIIDTVR